MHTKTSRKKKWNRWVFHRMLRQWNLNVVSYTFKKFYFTFWWVDGADRLRRRNSRICIEVCDEIPEIFIQSLNKNKKSLNLEWTRRWLTFFKDCSPHKDFSTFCSLFSSFFFIDVSHSWMYISWLASFSSFPLRKGGMCRVSRGKSRFLAL